MADELRDLLDPFMAAAMRQRQSVQPFGGHRREGPASFVLSNYLPGALESLMGLPGRAMGAAGELQRGGEYDPGPAMETALGMVGMPGVPRGALGSSLKGINWDTKTVSGGGIPIRKDQTVINVDPKALDAAFRSTDPEFYKSLISGRMDRLRAHVEAGKPVSLAEVGVVNGRLGFTNGRTRARLAAEQGAGSIPIAVDKSNKADVLGLLYQYGME